MSKQFINANSFLPIFVLPDELKKAREPTAVQSEEVSAASEVPLFKKRAGVG